MDKDLLETKRLADALSCIMDLYFQLNKKLDNVMDWLDIECNMNKLSAYIHEIAHTAPLVADHYRDFNAANGRRTLYRPIAGEVKDFTNILEPFEEVLEFIIFIQTEINNALDIAKEEDNIDAYEFLMSEIRVVREYKKQFVLFIDKLSASLNQNMSLQSIDNNWEDYISMEV